MQFEFDEKIEKAIVKSIKSAIRLFKEQQAQAQSNVGTRSPPTYDEFIAVVEEMMEMIKRADLNKLRTPSLRELYERAWSQKLRNYATQKLLRDKYEALVRRY